MKRLHRLVILSFLGPFVMTFFIVLFLLLMQFLWRYIDELVGKGLEFKIIGELLLYASSSLVPLALPLAILLSSLMTFGNMGEYYELTAMKSSGISLRKIMYPLIFLVMLMTVGAFFFANNVLPVTNLKMKSLLYDVRNQQPGVQITEGVFYNGISNYSIRVNRKDQVTNMLYDIKIYDHSSRKGNVSVIVADSGRMKVTSDKRNLVVTLWSGNVYTELEEKRHKRFRTYPHRFDKFQEENIIIEMTGFELMRSDESLFRNSYSMLNLDQLTKAVDSLQRGLDARSRHFYNNLLENSFFRMNTRNSMRFSPPMYNRSNGMQGGINPAPYPGNPTALGSQSLPDNMPASVRQRMAHPGDQATHQEIPNAALGVPPPGEKTPHVPAGGVIKANMPKIKVHNFDSLLRSYDVASRRSIIRTALNYTSMNQYMVSSSADNLKFDTRYLRRHEIEWHRKFTLSLACLIFLFIGAPLGAIIRKGGLGMPTVISTLLFILYYIMSLTGEKMVRESVASPFAGMWFSSFVLIVAGIFLTYEATNDSAILNLDSYINWIRDRLGLRKSVLLDKKAHLTGKFEILEISRQELQDSFTAIGQEAIKCAVKMNKEISLFNLANKLFSNTGYLFLIEFTMEYNSLIDRVILSQWFKIPYFSRRLSEFPLLDARLIHKSLSNRVVKWASIVIFPVWISLLLITWVKVQRMKRSLHIVQQLSAGMVNLLNSAALKTEFEYA